MAGHYARTAAHRAAIAAFNARTKRKYQIGYGVKSRPYRIWKAMRFRCYLTSHAAQKRYAAKNIVICDAWREDYLAFLKWALANGYADNLTIDRRDNDGIYSPENCRWATYTEQQRNKGNNLAPLTAFGETKLLVEWADDTRCVVTYARLLDRLASGRKPEWAITAPKRSEVRRKPMASDTKDRIAERKRESDIKRRRISDLDFIERRHERLPKAGSTFGRLTVTGGFSVIQEPRANSTFPTKRIVCECTCICGSTVSVQARFLSKGHVRSCGCLQRETVAKLKSRSNRGTLLVP